MHRGRPLLLCGHYWRDPRCTCERGRGSETGRATVQSFAPCASSWSEGQWSWSSQQQCVWTGMSGSSSWTHHCIVSFHPIPMCLCITLWIHITRSSSLADSVPETTPWCCLCFPTCWSKSQTSGWLTTCVLPSAGWSLATWTLFLWSRYGYSLHFLTRWYQNLFLLCRLFSLITQCSPTGCACSGGPSSTQRGHGGEQDSVQMPGYALHAQSCSGTPFFHIYQVLGC